MGHLTLRRCGCANLESFDGENTSGRKQSAERPRPKGKTVLIADDEESVLTTWRLILERAGYRVIAVLSAAEGLKALAGERIDALISDLHMERQNVGLELARAAMRLKPRPVVMLCTGYADVNNSRAALEMQVDHMATKPVELNELLAALASHLARRAAGTAGR